MFTEIKSIPQNISEVVCGYASTFIRLTNGKIMSCGYNNYGQLGHGDILDRTIFEEVYFDVDK